MGDDGGSRDGYSLRVIPDRWRDGWRGRERVSQQLGKR